MSLMDAMLLEGYRDPRDVYIALRADGIEGSGTIDDPYDGSVFAESDRDATVQIDPSDATQRTVVVTLAGHGFADGTYVSVEEVTQNEFNGQFFIFGVTTDQFRHMLAAPLPGVPDEFEAVCAGLVLRFDQVMSSLPSHAAIHIGPGVFETKGYSPQSPAWQPKAGQKIRGSGMGVTTLRLVGARAPINGVGQPTHAIGAHYSPFLDQLEISDLTIDCNLPGQIAPQGKDWAEVSCGGILVPGSHVRLSRVRAIRFGSQTPQVECFVLDAAWGHPLTGEPVGCVIEDCVVEQPSDNNVRETSCIGFLRWSPTQHRGCVIRHCFVNCEYEGGVSSHLVAVDSLLPAPGEPPTTRKWRLKTKGPHRRRKDSEKQNNIFLRSVTRLVGGEYVDYTAFNGAFPIDAIISETELEFTLRMDPDGTPFVFNAVIGALFHAFGANGGTAAVAEGNVAFHTRIGYYDDTGSTKDTTVRDNVFYDVVTGVYGFLGRLSEPISGTVQAGGDLATFTCTNPHGLWRGSVIRISDVTGPDADFFNGFWEVIEVSGEAKPLSFTYRMKGTPQGGLPHSALFREFHQCRHWAVDRNAVVLAPSVQSNASASTGFGFSDGRIQDAHLDPAWPDVYRNLVVRDNIVGHLGEVPDARADGIAVASVVQGIVEANLLRINNPTPLRQWWSNVHYFDNRNDAGELVQGIAVDEENRRFDELATRIEDALFMAL